MMNKLMLVALGVFGLNVAAVADPPSTHGMLIFGKGPVYVSHLPMYHRPHDYQVILKVSLGENESALVKDMEQNPNEPVYTIEPERFELPAMVKALSSFKATVYRGHFERGGKPIFKATVTPTKVVTFKKLNPTEAQPKELGMLVFGEGTEYFAAHVITKQPNFDQIVALQEPTAAQKIAIERLGGTQVVSGRQLLDTDPLMDGAHFPAPAMRPETPFQVTKVIYTETGDLE